MIKNLHSSHRKILRFKLYKFQWLIYFWINMKQNWNSTLFYSFIIIKDKSMMQTKNNIDTENVYNKINRT